MNIRHTMGFLHSFSIKNIFYNKVDLRFFCLPVTNYVKKRLMLTCENKAWPFLKVEECVLY